MAAYTSYSAKNNAEDVDGVITNIDPDKTPLFSSFAKTKASNRKHEWLTDNIRDSDPLNSVGEGQDSADGTKASPKRLANYVQEFQGVINVSDIQNAIDTIGYKSELAYQQALEGKALRLDIEHAIVSHNLSRPGNGAGQGGLMAGMESWISTNVSLGTSGESDGYDENTGIVAAPVDGTLRDLTEEMLMEVLASCAEAGGTPSKIIAGKSLKQAISAFTGGGAVKQVQSKDRKVTNTVSIIEGDFGVYDVEYHNKIRSRTVIAYDPDLWAIAVLQGFKTKDLPSNGSFQRKLINWVGTLVSKNEKGNAKIADVEKA